MHEHIDHLRRSFPQATRVLTEAAIVGKRDELRGLQGQRDRRPPDPGAPARKPGDGRRRIGGSGTSPLNCGRHPPGLAPFFFPRVMQTSFVPWTVAAVAVFWMVGAYNRLVRLRSDANAAFHALEAELTRQVQLVASSIPPEEDQPASQFSGGSAFWGGLQGAAAQMAASLASARVRPLDPERIAALGAAHEVLTMAWDRAERDDAHDLAGPRLPEDFALQRQQIIRMTIAATENFNQAVARYNEAITQFPALLLAWLFGFQPARGMRAALRAP